MHRQHQPIHSRLLPSYTWLEVLSVLGTIRNAVNALEAAAKWFEVCQAYILIVLLEFSHQI